MSGTLRYYIASTNGLKVLRGNGGAIGEEAEHFQGRTLEFLAGCRGRPEIVFAAVAFDGGYRTEDGGKSWRKVLDGDFRCFTVDPHDERVVYAGEGPIRLWRSEDAGLTWEPLDGLLALPDAVKAQWTVPASYRGRIPPHVCQVYVHPDDGNFLWLALEHGGLVYSRDRGETWEDASAGIDYLDMHVIGNLPGEPDRWLVSSARGFFASGDGGRHWRRSEDGMPWAYTEEYSYSHDWLFCPGDGLRIVLAGARGSPGVWARQNTTPLGHILLSDDEGKSWRRAASIPDDMDWIPWTLLAHPIEPGVIFAGMGDGARGFGFDPAKRGRGGLYRSDDRGESWGPVLADLPTVQTLWVAPD